MQQELHPYFIWLHMCGFCDRCIGSLGTHLYVLFYTNPTKFCQWCDVCIISPFCIQPQFINKNLQIFLFRVSLIFGAITCLAGILGVVIGSSAADLLRKKTSKADPYVCAFGLLAGAPCLFMALVFSRYNTSITYVNTISLLAQ